VLVKTSGLSDDVTTHKLVVGHTIAEPVSSWASVEIRHAPGPPPGSLEL
jgi:hypothetical protein